MSPTAVPSRHARGRAVWLALALLLCLPASPGVAGKEVPFLTAHVNDLAQMLPTAARDRVEQKLRDLETRTGAQLAVLTVPSLDGESLEGYSVRVAQTWKLGRKGVDDGVLLLIAKQDRKMRIEVGYGLESKLTDLASRRILDETIRPAFRQGDFAAGIEAGVDALVATIEGKPVPTASAERKTQFFGGFGILGALLVMGIFTVVIGIFSVIAVLTAGFAGWFLYVFLMPFYVAFPTAVFPPYGGVVACGAWVVAFPFLRHWLKVGSKDFAKQHPRLGPLFAGGGHSGSGGGWSSGGGFSGGGGSFGGGGSSSRW